ncbi:MAG: DUF4931 domain-containing protein [Patescibacteria group bacterium]|jgi:UDPglucose--hexose-1-phosphate uridylyltransferase
MAKKLTHSEIRQSYVHNRMVIIAPKRGARPHNLADKPEKPAPQLPRDAKDPFSPENLKNVKALLTLKGPVKPWTVKVIKNIFPAVSLDNDDAYGTQEVVVETPDNYVDLEELSVEHIDTVLEAYQKRTKVLAQNNRLQYILIFKNEGGRAGSSIEHSHSQIFSSGFVPPHVLEKLRRAEEYKIHHGISYYMDLLKREKNGPRWVMEEDGIAALTPYASYYNYEVWIMPTRPVDNITQLTNKERRAMANIIKKLLHKIDGLGLPYNFYLHQVVKYDQEHLYIRLAPRKAIWAGVELGTRLIINSVPPEEAAAFYRETPKKNRLTKKQPKHSR